MESGRLLVWGSVLRQGGHRVALWMQRRGSGLRGRVLCHGGSVGLRLNVDLEAASSFEARVL